MDEPIIPYTRNRMMEDQRAVIERDVAAKDKWGAKSAVNFQAHLTVPCAFWWWRNESGRSVAREYAEPQRTFNLVGGGVMLPPGTDVTTNDRIANITNDEGETIAEGPFRVVGKESYSDHIELSLMNL